MPVKVEAIAAQALCEWLRMKLPAKVTELNAARKAQVKAAFAGPYSFSNLNNKLKVWVTGDPADSPTVTLSIGTLTAAQVASEINTAYGYSFGSADSDGRLILTAVQPPSSDPSAVFVHVPADSSANTVFGWEEGGVNDVKVALVAPSYRGVMDGFPQIFNSDCDFNIIVGDRSSRPIVPSARRDEHIVVLDIGIMNPAKQGEAHANREHLHACVQAIREVILTTEGRQLGRAGLGDIVFLEEVNCRVGGSPYKKFGDDGQVVGLFDIAQMQLAIRVYERPPSS